MGKNKIDLMEYSIEYFILSFGIIGGVLIAQRIDLSSDNVEAKYIVGAAFIAFAALLTVIRNSKYK